MSEHKVCRRQLERVQGENVALKAEVERLKRADRFVHLLVEKDPAYDPSDYEEVLSEPEFWSADYAHTYTKLTEVMALQERAEEAETKLAKLVEALVALREESKAMPIPDAIPEGHKERLLVLRAHIADVAALAVAKEKP